MKPNVKIRAAAMLASVATTFVLLHWIALIGHPAAEPVNEAAQVSDSAAGAGA